MSLFRCGHCQEFSPLYEELAAQLGDKLLFVKMDGTANEAPAVFPQIQECRASNSLLLFME